uniref:Nucleoid occlusion factor SlmA n=1 Tax=Lygus hesperus TaxID=30085 RepID=A0A0A9Y3C5_LYGHE
MEVCADWMVVCDNRPGVHWILDTSIPLEDVTTMHRRLRVLQFCVEEHIDPLLKNLVLRDALYVLIVHAVPLMVLAFNVGVVVATVQTSHMDDCSCECVLIVLRFISNTRHKRLYVNLLVECDVVVNLTTVLLTGVGQVDELKSLLRYAEYIRQFVDPNPLLSLHFPLASAAGVGVRVA